ncbi:hypothetical protein PR048_021269 [Dryococelus australis]|uniref:Uncharacterized protein n=1 Tax=Dryococelus australis TaxID=614101 RepID=A0ABQ9GXT7_9NEOP|nr:hypothetical protein PR048_021269 [Dryococelus australis]
MHVQLQRWWGRGKCICIAAILNKLGPRSKEVPLLNWEGVRWEWGIGHTAPPWSGLASSRSCGSPEHYSPMTAGYVCARAQCRAVKLPAEPYQRGSPACAIPRHLPPRVTPLPPRGTKREHRVPSPLQGHGFSRDVASAPPPPISPLCGRSRYTWCAMYSRAWATISWRWSSSLRDTYKSSRLADVVWKAFPIWRRRATYNDTACFSMKRQVRTRVFLASYGAITIITEVDGCACHTEAVNANADMLALRNARARLCSHLHTRETIVCLLVAAIKWGLRTSLLKSHSRYCFLLVTGSQLNGACLRTVVQSQQQKKRPRVWSLTASEWIREILLALRIVASARRRCSVCECGGVITALTRGSRGRPLSCREDKGETWRPSSLSAQEEEAAAGDRPPQRHRLRRFPRARVQSGPAGDRTRIALVRGEQANRLATVAPSVSELRNPECLCASIFSRKNHWPYVSGNRFGIDSLLGFLIVCLWWLVCSPRTKAIRRRRPRDVRTWESCRTLPLLGGFSRDLPFPPPLASTALLHTHLASPSSSLKTGMLRVAQISSPPLFFFFSRATIEVRMEQRRNERAGETGDSRENPVSMEQRLNEKAAETGDLRENPPTNGIIRHDSHIWCLLTAVHSRCAQQEPITTVQPRETEWFPTTHKRAARDPLHTSCGVSYRAVFSWLKCNSKQRDTAQSQRQLTLQQFTTRHCEVIIDAVICTGKRHWRIIGKESAMAFVWDPSQHSPGAISENHGKPKSGWPDRQSNPDPPECESTVSLLASHQGDPGSISGRVTPGFSHVGIVPDDAVARRVFSGSPVSSAPSFRRCSVLISLTLIGSQDLDVISRPNLFTHRPCSN